MRYYCRAIDIGANKEIPHKCIFFKRIRPEFTFFLRVWIYQSLFHNAKLQFFEFSALAAAAMPVIGPYPVVSPSR